MTCHLRTSTWGCPKEIRGTVSPLPYSRTAHSSSKPIPSKVDALFFLFFASHSHFLSSCEGIKFVFFTLSADLPLRNYVTFKNKKATSWTTSALYIRHGPIWRRHRAWTWAKSVTTMTSLYVFACTQFKAWHHDVTSLECHHGITNISILATTQQLLQQQSFLMRFGRWDQLKSQRGWTRLSTVSTRPKWRSTQTLLVWF